MNIEAQRRSIAFDRRRVYLDGERFLVPVLGADVVQFRTATDDEVVYAAGESRTVRVSRTEVLDDRYLRELVRDQEGVRENGSIFTMQPMENLDREFDFDAFRHVNKRSRGHECFMQGCELCGTERGRLRHEMTAEQIFMLDDGTFQRFQDHAGSEKFLRQRIAPEKFIVGKNQTAGDFFESC